MSYTGTDKRSELDDVMIKKEELFSFKLRVLLFLSFYSGYSPVRNRMAEKRLSASSISAIVKIVLLPVRLSVQMTWLIVPSVALMQETGK